MQCIRACRDINKVAVNAIYGDINKAVLYATWPISVTPFFHSFIWDSSLLVASLFSPSLSLNTFLKSVMLQG